jgi:hypothetical protein
LEGDAALSTTTWKGGHHGVELNSARNLTRWALGDRGGCGSGKNAKGTKDDGLSEHTVHWVVELKFYEMEGFIQWTVYTRLPKSRSEIENKTLNERPCVIQSNQSIDNVILNGSNTL